MTTKFLTMKFAKKNPNFIVIGISQEKQRLGTIFRRFSPSPNPLQSANFINILSFRRL